MGGRVGCPCGCTKGHLARPPLPPPPPLTAPPQFGRTEVIDNSLNPDFVRKFVLDYFFEEKQNLRFDL